MNLAEVFAVRDGGNLKHVGCANLKESGTDDFVFGNRYDDDGQIVYCDQCGEVIE